LIFSFALRIAIVFPFTILAALFAVLNIVFCMVAAFKASEGKHWRYPLSLRIIDEGSDKDVSEVKREFKKAFK